MVSGSSLVALQARIGDACGDTPGDLCTWVYESTDNGALAALADWFVGRPLRIMLIFVVAWAAVRIVRRAIERGIPRMMNPHEPATERLERLGITVPRSLEVDVHDPRRRARANSVATVLASTSAAAIWTVAVIMILNVGGINVGPLIASAGIAGVALGFGAQSLVKDCIAGLFMLIEDQYGIGDVVDLGEATGVVEEVALRATVLRGVDGTVWHVPNGVVQRVGNMSQFWSVAVLDVDVAYDTDLHRARNVLMNAVQGVLESTEFADDVVEPATMLGVEALGADGITLRVTCKVKPGTQFMIQRRLREAVKDAFDAQSIEIPFPQRTVWTKAVPEQQATGNE